MDVPLAIAIVFAAIAFLSLVVAWKAKRDSAELQRRQTHLQGQVTAIEQARREEEIVDKPSAADAQLTADVFAWYSRYGKEVRVENRGPADAHDVDLKVWPEGKPEHEGEQRPVRPLLRAWSAFPVPIRFFLGTPDTLTLTYELSWRNGTGLHHVGPQQLSE
jgi:hypothetical protein